MSSVVLIAKELKHSLLIKLQKWAMAWTARYAEVFCIRGTPQIVKR